LTWAFLSAGLMPLSAQTPTPARPADPHQVIPAQPARPNPPATAPTAPVPVIPTNAPGNPEPSPAAPTLTVMADSSLREVLQELAQSWADSLDSSPQVPLTLTNAGTMRAKIEAGTVADLIISADLQDVKEMTDKGFLFAEGQRSIARNALVIYGRKALVKDDELEWFDLVGSEWKKVALGNPDLVASGRVAKRALQKHDLLGDENKNVFVYQGTETLALQVAEREQADAVFVYKTDLGAISLPGFEVISLKSDDAPPIFYLAAVCHLAKNPALGHAFIDYCTTDAAKEIWAKHGFETN
ncbi:MAG TPA: molybdate ABC transporter substrate-binding protein, partial [Candidatus Methylacidiphilales bacterium]